MANGRNMRAHKKGDKAFTESFVGIPKSVIYGPAYTALNKVERALLIEFALQYTGHNNGRLLCSVKQLKKRGFNSSDTLHRAKKVLLDAGLIYETVIGCRPNKASWYALTFRPLDPCDRYDPGMIEDFRKYGASKYKSVNANEIAETRAALKRKQNLNPSHEQGAARIAPLDGLIMEYLVPSQGTVNRVFH